MDRPRRRHGCLIACAGILLLLGITWWLLPSLACAAANTSLPREVGPRATVLALDPASNRLPAPAVLVQADPGRLRQIAAAATGRWIPPGVLRHGLGVLGTLRGAETVSATWRIEAADDVVPPRLTATFTPVEANALLISSIPSLEVAGFALVPRIATAEVSELPPGNGGRRFRVDASGALRLTGNGVSVDVPVRRLIGVVGVELTPAATGWEPHLTIEITDLDAPLPTMPGVRSADWRELIASAIEDGLADELAGRTLPAWFPSDMQLSAIVR